MQEEQLNSGTILQVGMPSGCTLLKDFISVDEEQQIIRYLDSNTWCGNGIEPNGELRRRTQQYGGLFLYKTRKVQFPLEPIPQFFDFLRERLSSHNIFATQPFNHLVVNEYNVNQGIMPHVDSAELFGGTICSLSLLSDCAMKFVHRENNYEWNVRLPQRSLLVMTGECRYKIAHSISKETVDKIGEFEIERQRRVSVTFRHVIEP
ncbi:hypothetical protein HDV06_005492 [Boothiomyces sp. JEL0866]|nr:hypothetical protein HDV06_005492 [Boothiomyces sp. JEL0866]